MENTTARMIYLDNSATTRIREEALAKYVEISRGTYGNPSSLHGEGLRAERVVTDARRTLLSLLGDPDGHMVFTASGTEANNLAILGRARAKERFRRGGKILTTAGEHASVSLPLDALQKEGFRVVPIPTAGGVPDLRVLREELTPDVVLVSMMHVNNETGALYDPAAVRAMIDGGRCPDALLHVDATQSFLKVPFTARGLGADMITLSSHKIEGPKGVGALYLSRKVFQSHGIVPTVLGGGQEEGLRSGTENVPGIAAFAVAASLGAAELPEHRKQWEKLRGLLLAGLREDPALAEVSVTDPPQHAPHILNITLPAIKSETMLHYLSAEGIYVSSGSACSSHGHHGSPALIAYGRTAAEADSSLRISLSYRNTEEDIRAFLAALAAGVKRLCRTTGRRR